MAERLHVTTVSLLSCSFERSSPETLEALKSLEIRSDDVILAGYPKTGTNWLEEMVRELESADAKYTEDEMKERINAEKELQMFPRLEFGDPGIYERMKKLPSRRIISTHLHPHLLPFSILQGKAKVLVLLRNPKDTAVSYYHFYNNMPVLPSFASWDEYFTAFMNGKLTWGSYFDQLVEWNQYIDHEKIMMISYEELKENPILGMKKIAAFFEFSLDEEDFHRIAKKTSFQAMKEKSKETHGKFGDILFRKGEVTSVFLEFLLVFFTLLGECLNISLKVNNNNKKSFHGLQQSLLQQYYKSP
uniref:Sulfotransferase n=1 Tax=Anas platyrhynchos platyrhynchos TaxID=8840 RepID=A0A493U213_ANAPP